MQDPSMPPSEGILNPKLRKKKISSQKVSLLQLQGNEVKEIQKVEGHLPLRTGQKASKRNMKNEVSPLFQLPERSNSDSLQDSSVSGNEYRVLRRKYLLLEEESYSLGRELREVEDEAKTLEDEKHALLDQLVVLEGLIDPLEVQSQGPQHQDLLDTVMLETFQIIDPLEVQSQGPQHQDLLDTVMLETFQIIDPLGVQSQGPQVPKILISLLVGGFYEYT